MLTTVEGIYKAGKIELIEVPEDVEEARVLVTFMETRGQTPPKAGQGLALGKYAGTA